MATSTANKNGTTTTELTAYGFAREVNKILKAEGYTKELPPQMFYQYAAKGMLGTEEKPLTAEYAPTWAKNYLARKVERAQKAEAKKEAELNPKGEGVDLKKAADASTEEAE